MKVPLRFANNLELFVTLFLAPPHIYLSNRRLLYRPFTFMDSGP